MIMNRMRNVPNTTNYVYNPPSPSPQQSKSCSFGGNGCSVALMSFGVLGIRSFAVHFLRR